MTTDPTHAPFDGVAGLYAVGALNADERQAFEQHLELCRGCVDEVMSLLPVAHVLTRAVPYHEPSPRLRDRVVRTITGAPPAPEVDDLPLAEASEPAAPPPPKRSGVGRVLFNLFALLVLAAAGGLGWYASQQVHLARALQENLDAANQRATVAELQAAAAREVAQAANERADLLSAGDLVTMALAGQPAAPAARARLHWSREQGVLLTATGLPPAPPGRAYHLWFVPATSPVSVGPLAVDDAGRLAANVPAPEGIMTPVPTAVTLEPEEAGEAPSGEVYLLGRPD